MNDLLLLSEAQMRRIKQFFPLSHVVPRIDERRVISWTIFTALVAAFVATPAVAIDWVKVSTAGDGTVVSIDASTVRGVRGTPKVWVKLDRSLVANSPFVHAKTLWKIDCHADTMIVLSSTSYDAVGGVRASQAYPDSAERYEAIVPESYGASIKRLLCKI